MIHTGGTLGMTGGRPDALKPEAFASTVHAFVPELSTIAQIDFEVLFNIDSSDLQPLQILTLARFIHERYERYDGFVVIHGTDTMVYTASALAFLFRGLAKPVVLTGSQRPLAEIRSDAKPNLIAACVVASMDDPIPEVAIFFGTELLRGCRSVKLHTRHFDAFESPNCPPLASLGVDVERGAHVRAKGAGIANPTPLESRLLCVRLFPGIDPEIAAKSLDGAKGVVIEAFGLGNVPQAFVPFLETARARGVPVVLTTQCTHGATDPSLYEGGRAALAAGAIAAGDLTTEAALMKLAVVLGRDGDSARAFAEDWAGERS